MKRSVASAQSQAKTSESLIANWQVEWKIGQDKVMMNIEKYGNTTRCDYSHYSWIK